MYRDIKGANLLVDAYGVVKLADFGMAKHVSSQLKNMWYSHFSYNNRSKNVVRRFPFPGCQTASTCSITFHFDYIINARIAFFFIFITYTGCCGPTFASLISYLEPLLFLCSSMGKQLISP